MNTNSFNYIDILIVIALVIAIIVALIIIARNKGKCAYCNHADSCPFKKGNDNVK